MHSRVAATVLLINQSEIIVLSIVQRLIDDTGNGVNVGAELPFDVKERVAVILGD